MFGFFSESPAIQAEPGRVFVDLRNQLEAAPDERGEEPAHVLRSDPPRAHGRGEDEELARFGCADDAGDRGRRALKPES